MKLNFYSSIVVKWTAAVTLVLAASAYALPGPVTITNLPPGKGVRVSYQISVNSSLTNGASGITNQLAVAGNFTTVSTDDPSTGAAGDPTVTLISVPPIMGAFTNSVAEDTTLGFTIATFNNRYSDANGDALTNIQITILPANATLKLNGTNVAVNEVIPVGSLGALTLLGATNFNGVSSFSWKSTDTTGLQSDNATTASITITEVNDAPVGTNDLLSAIAEDSGPRTILSSALTTNDIAGPTNENNQVLSIASTTNVVGGSISIVSGNVVFTPATNFNGLAGFTYTVQDNGTTAGVNDFKTNTATVSFTISEVNDLPLAVNDSLASVQEDSGPRTIPFATLLLNDSAGATNENAQVLTITSVTNALGGTVSISGTDVIFTPITNFNGTASFSYTVLDNGTTAGSSDFKSSTATASFTISEVADYDFGDAPASYGTTLANDGPRHVIPYSAAPLRLGASGGDIEADGLASSDAKGDNNNGINDEDGVVLPKALITGFTSNITVTASAAGVLNAWVDFNRNGNFNDAGEKILTNRALSAGANSIALTPGSLSPGGSFARFRFSSQSNLTPLGAASDGEVEDYGIVLLNTLPENKIWIVRSANGWMVRYLGIPGQSYIPQWAPGVDGIWTDLSGPLTADATGLVEYEDTTAPPPGLRFFRAKSSP